VTLDSISETREARELIRRCLSGDTEAARQFQQRYGELIYGYPIRVYRTPREDAGDFYVFAFESGRIFRRLRTFEGRAPLRAYLLGFVLDDLVLEWQRGERNIETVSIEAMSGLSEELTDARGLTTPDACAAPTQPSLNEILSQVEPPKAVIMKLLYIEDAELTASDIRYLADISGRSPGYIVAALDRLRVTVREREAALQRLSDSLDGVQAWIQLYERRLRRIADDLNSLPPRSMAAARLEEERAQLERKIQRRQQQRSKLLAQSQRRKTTAPYKDIAALLNTSIGNVASQIARLRRALREKGLGTGRWERDNESQGTDAERQPQE
jgi:RNA polymerase sigma factor (sigma-70 family)